MKKNNFEEILKKSRNEIDSIDLSILKLIQKRVKKVLEIGEVKHQNHLPVYYPKREQKIIERLIKNNFNSSFPNESLESIYQEIISACRCLESPLKVGYLGPEGSYCNLAAAEQFGKNVTLTPYQNIKDVFEQVQNKQENYGVVPIENSNEGIVSLTLDLFSDYEVQIFSQKYLSIEHSLLSKTKTLSEITDIYTHSHAFGQCRLWLQKNLPSIKFHETTSTSSAAKLVSKKINAAAIASPVNAKIYHLYLLKKGIQDHKQNVTRFIILSKNKSPLEAKESLTTILFALKDRPGALFEILNILAKKKINLSSITSRPSKKQPFQYSFYIDLQGHIKQPMIASALEKIKKKSVFFKLLGSYPK